MKRAITASKHFTLFAISALAAAAICALRNPLSFASPGLYQEEGIYTIDSLNKGLGTLLSSHNHYLDVSGRFINYISGYICFEHLAEITLLLYLLLTSLYLYQLFCTAYMHGVFYSIPAFLFLFFPTEPEWVGIPLYSFWVTTLLLFWREIECSSDSDLTIWWLILEVMFILSGPLTVLLFPLYSFRVISQKRARPFNFIKLLACSLQAIYLFVSILHNHDGSSADKVIGILLAFGDSLKGFLIRLSTPWTFVELGNSINIAISCILILITATLLPMVPKYSKHKIILITYLAICSFLLGLYGYSNAFIPSNQAAPRYTLVPLILATELIIAVTTLAIPSLKQSRLWIVLIASATSIFFSGSNLGSTMSTVSAASLPNSFAYELKSSYINGQKLNWNLRNTPGWNMTLSPSRIHAACGRSLLKCSFLREELHGSLYKDVLTNG